MKTSKTVFAFVFLILLSSSNLNAQNHADKKPEKPKNKIDYMDYCIKDPKKMNFKSREIKIESANETKINFHSGKKHVYLKLKDYPSKSKLMLLKKYNINLDNFVDDKAYLVELDQNKLNALKKMGFIEGVAEVQPTDKLSTAIKDKKVPQYAKDGNYIKVIIAFHKGVTFNEAKKALKNFNCKIESKKISFTNKITISIIESELEELASLEVIKYIEEIAPPKKLDNVKAGELSEVFWGDPVTGLYDTGYLLKGQGIKVAVEDGGKIEHPHFEQERIITVDNASPSYHATHVAGTIGLNIEFNENIPASARGMASEITLYSYTFSDVIDDYLDAISRSISIVNNSWGNRAGWDFHPENNILVWKNERSDLFGAYTSTSEDFDEVMYSFYSKHFVLIKSAGNHKANTYGGADTRDELCEEYDKDEQYDGILKYDPDGVDSGKYFCIDDSSCAKNIIVVGSVGDTIGSQEYDEKSSYFSSWGPTKDWRIKPDVVADGWNLNSSTMVIDNNGQFILDSEGKKQYTYREFYGTSMSAPVVTGITALIFQSFKDNYGRFPTADIVKALLCNFAEDLGRPGPDPCYGFGLVRAKPIIDAIEERVSSRVSHIATGTIMETGSELEYKFIINEPTNILSEDLKVTLAWVDPPSIPTDNATLINDLDIEIYEEGNETNKFYPFYFDNHGEPQGYIYHMENDGLPNRVDNIEQIVIPKGTQITNGNYVIKVKGYALHFLEQNFAIVSTIPMNNINFSDLSVRESRTNEEPGEWVSCNKLVADKTPDVRMMITELDNNGPDNGFDISSIKYKYSTDAGVNWNNDWLDVSGVYKDENCTEACGARHSGIAYAKVEDVLFSQNSIYLNKIKFQITYNNNTPYESPVYTIRNDNIFRVDQSASPGGIGTAENPYNSINEAVSKLGAIVDESNPIKLHIRGGIYNEIIYMQSNIELYGGYDENWEIDINNHKTIIDNDTGTAIYISGKNNIILSHLEISGKYNTENNNSGGGIYISQSENITISDCIIKDCDVKKYGGGGGIYLSYSNGIMISDCIIKDCKAGYGGGIFINATSNTIMNCSFENNEAICFGGGISLSFSDSKTINSIFHSNSALIGGGAVYLLTDRKHRYANCVFYNNSAPKGGAIYSNSKRITATFLNSIFWNNQSTQGSPDFENNKSLTIKNCCVQDKTIKGINTLYANPRLIDPANGNFHLKPSSPCINAGSNDVSNTDYAITSDKDGEPRIDGGTNICDIGIDELNYVVTYVDNQAGSQGDGTLTAPYQTIQQAINVAQGTESNLALIKVKAGTYNENLILGSNIYLCGGYGGENWSRDILANPTIINGNATSHVITISSLSANIVDGFTITNGNSPNVGGIYPNETSGGGIYIDGSSPRIVNCDINANRADEYGGGIYINNGSPVIQNCLIKQNTAGYGGGGIYFSDSSPEIFDCVIDSNKVVCGGVGGGICSSDSYGFISNSNIINNHCLRIIDEYRSIYDGPGGGAFITNSAIKIMDCIFEYNCSSSGGGICFSEDNNTVVKNTVFKGNICSGNCCKGGGVYYIQSNSKLLGCIFYSNTLVGESTQGHEIYIFSGSPFITNCTFYGGGPSGICINEGTLTISNSIIYNTNIEHSYWPYFPNVFTSRCWFDDPLFKDPENGDFHLHADSRCIDAGNDGAVGLDLLLTDIDSEHRRDTRHNKVDIGADETIDTIYYVSKEGVDLAYRDGLYNTPWETIQFAIDNVPADENQICTILVGDGIYNENLKLRSHINLYGIYDYGNVIVLDEFRFDPPLKPIINGKNIDSVIVAAGTANSRITNCSLCGFKITNINQINSEGGGIKINYADIEISFCDIINNKARCGGGIYLNHSSAKIEECNISNNSSTSGGGGLQVSNSSVEMLNCLVKENITTAVGCYPGGGIHLDNSTIQMNICNIFKNSSAFSGGGISLLNTSANIINSAISENLSAKDGGGIYSKIDSNINSKLVISNSLINENKASSSDQNMSNGGGIYFYSNLNPTLTDPIFEIRDSIFENNIAKGKCDVYGGGIYLLAGKVRMGTIINSIFRFNSVESESNSYGGAIYTNNFDLKLLGSTIYSNDAKGTLKTYGGIYFYNLSLNKITVTNCNIVNNSPIGIFCGKANFYNSIIWDNLIKDQFTFSSDKTKFYNCCIQDISVTGTNVIHDNPKFFDPENGNFHIYPSSPCVDNGKSNDLESTGLNLLLKDIDGQDRIDLESGKCDIGVDEVHAYYVDGAVSDQGQGTKSSPWKTIQLAIAMAHEVGINTLIYVKGGTYYENITLLPNVFLYGGYDDNWQRNLESNPTIINGNAEPHTVSITSSSGTFTPENSLIDGFTITNGSAIKYSNDPKDNDGGGIYINGTSPKISNCTIKANTAINNGGGIFITGGSPKIQNCVIEQNTAFQGGGITISEASIDMSFCTVKSNEAKKGTNSVYCPKGGGIYADGASGSIRNCSIENNSCIEENYETGAMGGGAFLNSSSLNISDCVFDNNSCESQLGNYKSAVGGGILLNCDFTVIKNSIFKNNKVLAINAAHGGAISFLQSSNSILGCIFYANDSTAPWNNGEAIHLWAGGSPIITNCTFYSNGNNAINISDSDTSLCLTNCILWGNGDEISIDSGTISLNSCCIQGNDDNGPGVIHDNPQLVDPDYGDFHLRSDSPCIDAGNDGAIGLNLLETDVYGEPRIDSAANNCDMGADEFNHIYYVAKNGNNQGAGNSEHPWATIQYAINTAQSSQTEVYSIYVQEGTYNENVVLKSYVNLHGGYDSNWQRDVASNPTSIQVTGGSAVTAAANSTIDGFTISGGSTTGGSGVRIHQITDAGTVSVSNCIIENNTAVGSGAGFSAYECPQIEAMISDCKIRNNTANNLGGAAFIQNTKVIISNCEIENNTATVGGGIDFTGTKEVVITNSSFVNNMATSTTAPKGGGIYATGATGKIKYCDFRNNTALSTGGTEVKGGGLCITASTFEVSDSIFDSNTCSSNTANVYGGGICVQYNGNNLNTVIKNCTINGNLAYSSTNAYGGAVEILNSGVKLLGSVVCNNYAEGDNDGKGGAIDISVGTYQNYVTNSQIYGNIASTEQFGGVAKRSGTLAISNSILWNNDNDIYGTADLANCCIQDNDDGTGVIHDDPMFVNPENGDFHLQENSPCIDAGNDGAVGVDLLNKDIDSQYRINNNVDIGTDEYYN